MAKRDGGMLWLLLLGGGALALASGAKAATPPRSSKPEPEPEPEEPRGVVTVDEGDIRVITPDQPEGRVIDARTPEPASTDEAASKAAAAAVDAMLRARPSGTPIVDIDSPTRRPATPSEQRQAQDLYPSAPAPTADMSDPEPLPQGRATLNQIPAPVAAPPGSSSPRPNLPAGYDPATARRGARAIAAHLKRAGRANYDRRLLEQWQRAAGLVPDRIYGGGTRGALLFYGVPALEAPAPFFAPTQTVPFTPPEKR